MRKTVLKVLCAGMILGVLTACGSTTQENAAMAETTAAETTAAETTVAETTAAETTAAEADDEKTAMMEALKLTFLEKADQVEVSEDAVTFYDAVSQDAPITISKNPEKVVNLYGSFTTLWYEAGGQVTGCIGGDSLISLYEEYIGRDITADEGVTVVAKVASGKKWDVEGIISLQPDLIICSKAMSGYATIEAPAKAADIPVIVVDYDDFSDYLKWFKVFCNLTGQPQLWDEVAMKSLDEVVTALAEGQAMEGPTVFSMFSGADSLQANTSNTVVGGMITAMNANNIVDSWGDVTGAERLDINLETVYMANPDIILVQCHAGAEAAKEQVAELYGEDVVWKSLKAVQEGKVYFLEKELFHNKPNSRFAEAYLTMAELLYPEIDFAVKE